MRLDGTLLNVVTHGDSVSVCVEPTGDRTPSLVYVPLFPLHSSSLPPFVYLLLLSYCEQPLEPVGQIDYLETRFDVPLSWTSVFCPLTSLLKLSCTRHWSCQTLSPLCLHPPSSFFSVERWTSCQYKVTCTCTSHRLTVGKPLDRDQ